MICVVWYAIVLSSSVSLPSFIYRSRSYWSIWNRWRSCSLRWPCVSILSRDPHLTIFLAYRNFRYNGGDICRCLEYVRCLYKLSPFIPIAGDRSFHTYCWIGLYRVPSSNGPAIDEYSNVIIGALGNLYLVAIAVLVWLKTIAKLAKLANPCIWAV